MDIEKSMDGTVKFNFEEGYSAVLIPLGERLTFCVSSQVGCPMKCVFCASGRVRFQKNLSLEQMKEQLQCAIDYLELNDLITPGNTKGESGLLAKTIGTIVFMGMGEPMLNLKNVLEFCDFVNEKYSYAYSKIAISTSGVIPRMNEVIDNPNKINLALSLHSPIQEKRDVIMPVVKNYPITELVKVCNRYNENYKHKIMIEYVMIDGLNDTDEDLEALVNLGLSKMTNFNLIPLNGDFELGGKTYGCSPDTVIVKFRDRLMQIGYKCFTRTNMGTDIEAACGMLK